MSRKAPTLPPYSPGDTVIRPASPPLPPVPGRVDDRKELEKGFYDRLQLALNACSNMGNRKRTGYVMGAFREALKNYHVDKIQD